ncbi:hypothetical protein O181_085842 [Austropuccinia psidii MF-1]|uniref:Uncharacterized protein n=1 Tax=Austropuccinia psidii MF-1 TaxID=1389203 RepID=A0A9Q3FWV7_9BASI|nr:hypothetical protein [Austropuccinia psidii MF-1]
MSKKGEINETNIEKESVYETDAVSEQTLDDISSIFFKYSKDLEKINVTFEMIESYSHLPQLSNSQPYFLKNSGRTTYESQTKQREGLYSWKLMYNRSGD